MVRRLINLGIVIPGFFLLSACSNLTPKTSVNTDQLPSSINLSEVPFFPQKPLLCGPAALATALNYYNSDITSDSIEDNLWSASAKGTYGLDMIATTRSNQFVAFQGPKSLEQQLRLVAEGWPSIHLLNLGFKALPQWHYATLVGYDIESESVLLRSGKIRERWMSFGHFERSRRLAGYWSLIPAPYGEFPFFEDWQLGYKAVIQQQKIDPDAAPRLFETAISTYPDHWQYPFALANYQYGQKNYSTASKLLEKSLSLEPLQIEIWNNLAYSYKAQNCRDAALAAIQCAVDMSPDNDEIRSSQTEIETYFKVNSSTNNTNQCMQNLHCPVQ